MFGMMMLFIFGFTIFCFYILILGFWDVYGKRKEESVVSRQVKD
jgi:hypothetical protein